MSPYSLVQYKKALHPHAVCMACFREVLYRGPLKALASSAPPNCIPPTTEGQHACTQIHPSSNSQSKIGPSPQSQSLEQSSYPQHTPVWVHLSLHCQLSTRLLHQEATERCNCSHQSCKPHMMHTTCVIDTAFTKRTRTHIFVKQVSILLHIVRQ